MNMLADWNRARKDERIGQTQRYTNSHAWCKPPMGWIKINTDATCRQEAGTISLGCVITDDKGDFVQARSSLVQVNYPPRVAEALSLKEALAWIKNWRTSKCIFEANAKLLVDAVNTVNVNQGNSMFRSRFYALETFN